ncbi:MAG: hypothetical protein R2824_29865 [Saprospiraceae bacterium]
MQRKFRYLFIFLVILGLSIWALDRWSVISVWPVNPEDCLPAQAGLVVALPEMGALTGITEQTDPNAWQPVIGHLPGLTSDLALTNELIDALFPSRTLIDQARGLLIVNAIDDENLSLTWLIDIRNLGNPDPTTWLEQKKIGYSTSSFRGKPVWTVRLSNGKVLAIARHRNILILGQLPYQVEAVLAGTTDGNNWLKQLGRPTAEEGTFTIYWKADSWGDIQKAIFTTAGLNLSKGWERWLESAKFICRTENNGVRISGELRASGRLLGTGIAPGSVEGELWSLLPATTASIKLINLSDNQDYFRQLDLRSVSRFHRFFRPWLKGPVLELGLRPLDADAADRRLYFYSYGDRERMDEALNDWMAEVGILRTIDYQGFQLTQANEDQHLFPWSDQSWKNPWWTVVGPYLLLSENRTTLENWIDQYTVGNTLPLTEVVRQITPSSSGGQFYFYLDWEQWRTAWKDIVKNKQLANALPELGQTTIRVKSKSMDAELDGLWMQGMDSEDEGNLIWRQRLSDLIAAGPWICSIGEGETLILVQGRDNQLFAYDINGKLRWQRQWNDRIISPVKSIPLKDRRALVFNTRNAIYLTEINGTPIAPFPLNLRNETAQAVTVVDFSDNREYSFFIVSTDGCVYGYDQEGGPVTGWSPKCNLGPVDHPLLHFQDANMDYLLVRNIYGSVRAFARDGSVRLSADFPGGEDAMCPQLQSWEENKRIVMASDSGQIQTLSLLGQPFQLQLPVEAGQPVEMVSDDFFGNNRSDYLVAAGRRLSLHGYTSNGMVKRFEKTFPQRIERAFVPDVDGRGKKKIGILLEPAEKIYLLDEEGEPVPGFPLAGSTPFLLLDLFQTGEQQIIVGYRDELLVYQLEAAH